MAVGLAACFLMDLRKVNVQFVQFFLVVIMGVTTSKLLEIKLEVQGVSSSHQLAKVLEFHHRSFQ